jgi:outer membrane protein assembly factor BamA
VRRVGVAVLLALASLSAIAAEPPTPIVDEITIVGGSTIDEDTVEYYLGVAKGDPYDPEAIAKSFHRFWDSGLVEDVKVEAEEMAPGKVRLIVTVKERPKVTEWAFAGNKKLSTSTIREQLETANVSLKKNVPLRTSEVQRLRQAILDACGGEGTPARRRSVVAGTGPASRSRFRSTRKSRSRSATLNSLGTLCTRTRSCAEPSRRPRRRGCSTRGGRRSSGTRRSGARTPRT